MGRPSARDQAAKTAKKKDGVLNFAAAEKAEDKLKRQTYYMSKELIDALSLMAFVQKTDKSGIVRQALEKHIPQKYFNAGVNLREDD